MSNRKEKEKIGDSQSESKSKVIDEKSSIHDKRSLEEKEKQSVEKAAVAALRIGDVSKALRILNAAPLAPKNEATFNELVKLHPSGSAPAPTPLFSTPTFSMELVKTALASFGPGSAAGLFGYRPSLLQQCVRAESFSFLHALTSVVNQLASGRAPQFLQPFLAGGVAIALAKPNRGVRPLCCGSHSSLGWEMLLYRR